MIDGVQSPDTGPSGGGGAACYDSCERSYASADCAAERKTAGHPISADGGARERGMEAEASGVAEDLRMLQVLVEHVDVPLEGAVTEVFWRCAFGADGGAPDLAQYFTIVRIRRPSLRR